MKVEGYKANSYDATYSQAVFDVRRGAENADRCVIVIEDLGAGTEFIFEIDKKSELYKMFDANLKQKPRTRGWRTQDPEPEKGSRTVTYGNACSLLEK